MAWKHLFAQSSSDYGTLAFFKSRLNRSAVTKEPKKCVDAAIEFLDTVVKGLWVGSACEILGISSPNAPLALPPNVARGPASDKLAFVRGIALKVVERLTLVDIALLGDPDSSEDSGDKVYSYTRVLCHYGALMEEFRDGWREGDGERVLRCWKLFMLHFKASGATKYALEALRLQFQLKTLSPNLAHQVKWHRFVNTHGGLGRNIPCDLHNEHVNKLIKETIHNQGPNLTEQSLQRAVRSSAMLDELSKHFEAASNVPAVTSAHSTRSDAGDVEKVASIALRHNLLVKQARNRTHLSFPKISSDPLVKLDRTKTLSWIVEKKAEFCKNRGRFKSRPAEVEVDIDIGDIDIGR